MEKNIFGGGNKNSVYVPLSEVEQEALQRVVENHNMIVKIKGWGSCRPIVQFGDSRVALYLWLSFTAPEVPVPVHYFDLELWNDADLLRKDRVSLIYNGSPTLIGAGIEYGTVWEIAIHHMDPLWVKKMTGATGLTSRVLDKTTGKFTLQGNMNLGEDRLKILHQMRMQEREVHEYIAREREIITSMQKQAEANGEVKILVTED